MNGLADVDGFKICIQVCGWASHPWAHACENITLPHTSFAGSKNSTKLLWSIQMKYFDH